MNKIGVLKSSYISSYLIWSVGAVNMEKSQLKKGVEKKSCSVFGITMSENKINLSKILKPSPPKHFPVYFPYHILLDKPSSLSNCT